MNENNILLRWFQRYCQRQLAAGGTDSVEIITYDNPGWGIDEFNKRHAIDKKKNRIRDESENDWIFLSVQNGEVAFSGGPLLLKEILYEFRKYVDPKISFSELSELEEPLLEFLQSFYSRCCDGDWEHTYGQKFEIKSDLQWNWHLDLTDTIFDEKKFNTVDIRRSESDWFHCVKTDEIFNETIYSVFTGTGGVHNLIDMISTFRDWVYQVVPEYDRLEKLYIP